MSQRIHFITYKDKKVLIEDFSGLAPGEEFDTLVKQAQNIIHSEPQKSVLALFDASGIRFNQTMVTSIKDFTASNNDYVKAAATVGIEGLLTVILNSISKFTGRNFKTFPTREAALEWLIAQ